MGRSRVLMVFVGLVLAMGLIAGYGALDRRPSCPVGHQDVRFGDVEREFLVRYAVGGESVNLTDHAWITIHENSSVAIGSVVGARRVFLHPENGTLEHELQSFEGTWRTDRGNVSLWVDFRRDDARITIQNRFYERSIEGPVVEYCGPLD